MANRNYRGSSGRQFSHNPWQHGNTSAQTDFGYAAELASNRNLLMATDIISNIFSGQGSNNSSQYGNSRQNSYGFQFGRSPSSYGMGYSNAQNGQNFRARQSGPVRSSGLLARSANTRYIKKVPNKSDTKNIVASKVETVEIGEPSEYDTLSKEALSCHICDRNFDSGKTFVEHLRSRKHKVAMTYAEMEYTTLSNVAIPPGPGERKRIKKYLQASCAQCRLSFNSRIQLDEHLLSLQHLKRLPKKSEAPTRPELQVFTLEQESVFLRAPKVGKKGQKIVKKESDQGTAVKEDGVAVPLILDIEEGQDFTQVKEGSIPGYSAETGVGKSFVADFILKRCSLCNKLLDSDETVQVHLRTRKHYQNYVAKLRVKAGLPAMKPEKREKTFKKENMADVNESGLKKLKIGDDEKMDTNDVPDNVAQILDGDDMWSKIDEMIEEETTPEKESAN